MDTDKIVTTDGGSNFANGALMGANLKNSGSDFLTALLAGGGGMNNWVNNPFIYLVWMMFAQNMWGGNGQGGTQAQIQALQGVVQDNHNSDLLMQAMQGNTNAITQLAGTFNASIDQVTGAINAVQNAITAANGNIQLAAQQMIANNNLQSAALGSQIQNQGAGIQREILSQGYQNQIGNLQQTNQIQAQGQQLQGLISAALTQLGFAIERNASASQATSTSNTQRIIDALTNHWNLEQQTTIQQLRDEVGRLNQSNQLIAALKGTATATSTPSAS